jgi:TPR repeat protein
MTTEKQAELDQAKANIEAGNCQVAIPFLLRLAETGNREAQFLLGYMYFADCEYPFADSVARDWLVKAKEQGHSDACYYLAWFPNAQGISCIDDQEAMNLLIEAGKRGSVAAQRELGGCFATGDWIPSRAMIQLVGCSAIFMLKVCLRSPSMMSKRSIGEKCVPSETRPSKRNCSDGCAHR